jgi:hypothetical protein
MIRRFRNMQEVLRHVRNWVFMLFNVTNVGETSNYQDCEERMNK